MNTELSSVYGTGNENTKKRLPKVSFRNRWLSPMGFLPGALVQAMPVKNGMNFTLCDENIRSYRELANTTKAHGGKLIHVTLDNDNRKKTMPPALITTGSCIHNGGLAIGDKLLAMYDSGIVQVRKIEIDDDTQIVPMRSTIEQNVGERIPKLWFCGYWLTDYGFSPGTLATASTSPGGITLELHDKPYTELVPYARRSRLKVVQIHAHSKLYPKFPNFGITGSYLTTAGFGFGDVLTVACSPGRLQIEKLNLDELGFQFQQSVQV